MCSPHGRKVLFATLLAAVLSAPASAIESVTTTQQTAFGQKPTEVASLQTKPIVLQESYTTLTNERIAEPPARPKVSDVRPSMSPVRQPNGSAGYYKSAAGTPLILGIGY